MAEALPSSDKRFPAAKKPDAGFARPVQPDKALAPAVGSVRLSPRPRLGLRSELALALLPTAVVLLMLCGVEAFSQQRLLFASLASSAFLIYVDPDHPINGVRTVVLAQGLAALIGFGANWWLGPGYFAAGVAMVVTIIAIIVADAMHPPAVSTALTFAFRASAVSSLSLFGLSMVLIILLVVPQRASVWLLRRFQPSL